MTHQQNEQLAEALSIFAPNQANKKTLQCGFVLFQSTEDADRCIEYMNGKRFHGRDIKVLPFSAFTNHHPNTSGIIHISFKAQTPEAIVITEETIRSAVQFCGEITDVAIRKLDTAMDGCQCGFGFLTFKTLEENIYAVRSIYQRAIEGVIYDCQFSDMFKQSPDFTADLAALKSSRKAMRINQHRLATSTKGSSDSDEVSSSPLAAMSSDSLSSIPGVPLLDLRTAKGGRFNTNPVPRRTPTSSERNKQQVSPPSRYTQVDDYIPRVSSMMLMQTSHHAPSAVFYQAHPQVVYAPTPPSANHPHAPASMMLMPANSIPLGQLPNPPQAMQPSVHQYLPHHSADPIQSTNSGFYVSTPPSPPTPITAPVQFATCVLPSSTPIPMPMQQQQPQPQQHSMQHLSQAVHHPDVTTNGRLHSEYASQPHSPIGAYHSVDEHQHQQQVMTAAHQRDLHFQRASYPQQLGHIHPSPYSTNYPASGIPAAMIQQQQDQHVLRYSFHAAPSQQHHVPNDHHARPAHLQQQPTLARPPQMIHSLSMNIHYQHPQATYGYNMSMPVAGQQYRQQYLQN